MKYPLTPREQAQSDAYDAYDAACAPFEVIRDAANAVVGEEADALRRYEMGIEVEQAYNKDCYPAWVILQAALEATRELPNV